jgi:hypothetical protein
VSGTKDTEQQRNSHIRRSLSIVTQFLSSILFMVGVLGVVGVLIYGLLQVALFDKRVYAYFFLALCVILLCYLVFRLVRRRKLSGVLRKVARVFVVLLMVVGLVALVFIYGSLFVRAPLIAYISAPFVLFFFIYLLPRFNMLQKIRRFFS